MKLIFIKQEIFHFVFLRNTNYSIYARCRAIESDGGGVDQKGKAPGLLAKHNLRTSEKQELYNPDAFYIELTT